MQTTQSISVVVAERGSDWASYATTTRANEPAVVVIEQDKAETATQLARRVRTYVDALESQGKFLENAVLVGGAGTDSDVLAARSLAIRAIVSPMVRHGRGTVLLHGSGRDRHTMKGLATTVSEMIRGSGVDVLPVTEHVVAA